MRPVDIGNDVFLGWGCTILAGTSIGDNVIIGAGAVVSGKVESNSVYAGNPAKRIMSIDEYLNRRRAKQLSEAVEFCKRYKARYGKMPEDTVLGHYSRLYSLDAPKSQSCYNEQVVDLPFQSREAFESFVENAIQPITK